MERRDAFCLKRKNERQILVNGVPAYQEKSIAMRNEYGWYTEWSEKVD